MSVAYRWDTITWKDNYVFHDTLKFVEIVRRGHVANFIVESLTTGTKYPMFLSEVMRIFGQYDIIHGVVEGEFTFVKRGTKFALGLARGVGGEA